jgi:hypothetical protein
LQDGLEDADEIALLVNNVVVQFDLNVETKRRFYLVKDLLEGTQGIIFFNFPSYNLTIFVFPQQRLSCLSRSLWTIAKELGQTQFGYSLLKHTTLKLINVYPIFSPKEGS